MSSINTVRRLNRTNINTVIDNYIISVKEIPLQFKEENFLSFFEKIKRIPVGVGPYPSVSLFEASNRIMTDLTLIFGIKNLLNGAISEINFEEYVVEFGNENRNENDVEAVNANVKLRGEVFNVAKSYFAPKKSATLRKMRKLKTGQDILLLICNKDATNNTVISNLRQNEYFLFVDVEKELRSFNK